MARSTRPPRSAAAVESTGAAPSRATGRATATAESAADRPRTDAEVLAEARFLTADWSADRLTAQRLRSELALEGLLLTRSEEGMTLFDEHGEAHVAAQAREVFDVTGAGDTVIATMAALVAAGCSLRDAMPMANKAGAIVVGKFGTATASYEELFGTD